MVEYCENGCGAIPTDQAETTMKLLGKTLCPKCADKESEKTANELTLYTKPLTDNGFVIERGTASKVIGQAEVTIDIVKFTQSKDLDGRLTAIQIAGYDYEIGLHKEVDAVIKTVNAAMPKNGKKETTAPQERHEKEHTEAEKGKDQAAERDKAAERGAKQKSGVETYPMPHERPPQCGSGVPPKQAETLPAPQEKAKPPGKPITDAERDAMIERAKAEKFLTQRGSSYRVQGKERPDSHMIQNLANDRSICIEIREAVQTDNYAHVVVRGHLRDQYVDAVVHHDFSTEYLLKVMEIAKKTPQIIDHWEGTAPVLKADAVLETEDRGMKVKVSAQYYVAHALLSFRKFALRDARTKAASITEAMLLNRDWRDEDEVQSEESETALVQDIIKNRNEVS